MFTERKIVRYLSAEDPEYLAEQKSLEYFIAQESKLLEQLEQLKREVLAQASSKEENKEAFEYPDLNCKGELIPVVEIDLIEEPMQWTVNTVVADEEPIEQEQATVVTDEQKRYEKMRDLLHKKGLVTDVQQKAKMQYFEEKGDHLMVQFITEYLMLQAKYEQATVVAAEDSFEWQNNLENISSDLDVSWQPNAFLVAEPNVIADGKSFVFSESPIIQKPVKQKAIARKRDRSHSPYTEESEYEKCVKWGVVIEAPKSIRKQIAKQKAEQKKRLKAIGKLAQQNMRRSALSHKRMIARMVKERKQQARQQNQLALGVKYLFQKVESRVKPKKARKIVGIPKNSIMIVQPEAVAVEISEIQLQPEYPQQEDNMIELYSGNDEQKLERTEFQQDSVTVAADDDGRQMCDKICQEFETTTANICINALAGCGKTYTLQKITNLEFSQNLMFLYLVFNRENADEAKEKFGRNVRTCTIHEFCGNLVNGSNDTVYTPKGKNKTGEIVKRVIGNANYHVEKICSLLKADAYNPEYEEIQDIKEKIQEYMKENVIQRYQYFTEEQKALVSQINAEKIHQILSKCVQPKTGIMLNTRKGYMDAGSFVDCDDVCWRVAIEEIEIATDHVILIDEAQDLNRSQIILLDKFNSNGARIVYVGDPNQSIYKFRGANEQTFPLLRKLLEPVTQTELIVNYRCDPRIIEFCNRYTNVKNLQAGNSVSENRKVTVNNTRDQMLANLKPQDCLLARRNQTLFDNCIEIILNTDLIPFWLGNNFVAQLEMKMKTIGSHKYVNDWQEARDDCDPNLHEHIKLIDNVIAMCKKMKTKTTIQLYKDLKTMLEQKEKRVTLMTIHKCKGLEFENVWLLDTSKFADDRDEAPSTALKREIENQIYIAITRARTQLHFVQ